MKQLAEKRHFLSKKVGIKKLTPEQLLAIRGGDGNELPPPPPPIIGTIDIVDF